MESLLSFIAKFIGAPARVGAAAGATVALSALVIRAARWEGVEPFAAFDVRTYQCIMSAGVFGFSGVVVIGGLAGLRRVWAKLQQWYRARALRKLHNHEAVKNLEVPQPEFSATLRFLKAKNTKRFRAQANNDLLREMSQSFLLEIDDRLYFGNNQYYEVRDCVWDRIDSNLPPPKSPPWVDRA
jgi:hypothetical protein